MSFILLSILSVSVAIDAAPPRQVRSLSHLPPLERDFAKKLSVRKRRIFCGQFTPSMRLAAIQYTNQEGEKLLTPDEAVLKVMEESGMSMARLSRQK